jgi:uncharacterized protein YecT (DUF1311 family)
MSANVFINYRRDDVAGMAGRLYDRLTREFPKHSIFMDVDAMRPGLDFAKQLDEQVASCGIVLALIGPSWLNSCDEGGQRRLDNPHDWVRLELASALRRDIPVVPVLLKGASLPREQDLPDELKPLVRRHAVEMRHARFGADADLVIAAIREVVLKRTLGSALLANYRGFAVAAAVALVLGGAALFFGKAVFPYSRQSASTDFNWQADPSFNCAKYAEFPESSPARSPQGDVLCHDVRLSDADSAMAKIYRELRGNLGSADADKLFSGQKEWIRRRNLKCPVSFSDLRLGDGRLNVEAVVQAGKCLRAETDARAEVLSHQLRHLPSK